MAGQNPGSPTDFQYFYEDEVFKINNCGQVVFGLVLENYETNSSDLEESDAETPIQKGEIRVVWHPSGTERVVSEKSVGLADRSLMPGDVVRRMIRGKDTQRGYCRDIIMTAAVQVVGTNHVIPCVMSDRLQPLEEFTSDLAVCLDSWVGTSKTVHSKLRLVSADGSRLEYPDPENCPLEDFSVRNKKQAFYTSSDYYYPGQVVTCPLGSLDQANWIHTTKDMKAARKHKMREYKFTVEGVEAESVGVHWQCRALCTNGDSNGTPLQPRFLVEGEDLKRLKLLNVFEPCTLQVGDRSFLTITEEDKFTTKKQWRKAQSKYYRTVRRANRPQRSRDKEESKEKDAKEALPQASAKSHSDAASVGKHSHGSFKAKKRSLHNRDLIKCLFHSPAHSAKLDKGGKSSDSKMDIDVAVNHPGDNSNSNKEVEDMDSVADASGNPSVIVELCDTPAPITAERMEDGKDQEERISRIPDNNVIEVAVNGDCKPGDSANNLSAVNEDDDENWENTSSDDGTDTDSAATWSSRCSSGANSAAGVGGGGGAGKRSPQLGGKFLRGARLRRAARRLPAPSAGARVVVETLCTSGRADVIWQDGTVERGIPSTQLYPIHHLDNQECFPGDFVVLGESGPGAGEISQRDYGVVQKVDHHGRTAQVKWFRTYTTGGEPDPEFLHENEVSVYDLKDHPDFQYRPGTVVIRVANFTGTETNCTAGQVIDNFPSGRVKVWWADGHTSMCCPQDLYKVGEYDSEDGELWAEDNEGSDDASWVTQSENEQVELPTPTPEAELPRHRVFHDFIRNISTSESDGREPAASELTSSGCPKIPRLLEGKVAAHIERGRMAMQKLEEMFFKDPKLQTQEVMRKLLCLYKECRFLDRLMGTSFFHEELFRGLVERVKEKGDHSCSKESMRVLDQVHRLFAVPSEDPTVNTLELPSDAHAPQNSSPSASPKTNERLDSVPDVSPICSGEQRAAESASMECDVKFAAAEDADVNMDAETDTNPQILVERIKGARGSRGSSERKVSANEDSGMDCPMLSTSLSVNNTTFSNNSSERSFPSCEYLMQDSAADTLAVAVTEKQSVSAEAGTSTSVESSGLEEPTRNVCYKLCSLLRAQLLLAHAEVNRRRPALLAQFLNTIMAMPRSQQEQLPYYFSVQFNGVLVVSMKDAKKEEHKGEIDPQAMSEYEDANSAKENEPPTQTEDHEEEAAEKDIDQVVAVVQKETSRFGDGFAVLESAPSSHRFLLSMLQPSEPRAFFHAVSREMKLLRSDLPPLVWVRSYEDRIDLLSLMIGGPEKTPYEDGLFLFDVQLGGEYPRAPPMCHYISYCMDRLNPNLYEDGKVCVSLLGTWSGRGVEVWGKDSSLLQVIVSIQGLILNSEPYFNEAGYEKQKGSQQGRENSRMYNEMVILKLVQSMTKLVSNPAEAFKAETLAYLGEHGPRLCRRLEGWMAASEAHNAAGGAGGAGGAGADAPAPAPDAPAPDAEPDFPLIPASRGFCLTLRSSLDSYRAALQRAGLPHSHGL